MNIRFKHIPLFFVLLWMSYTDFKAQTRSSSQNEKAEQDTTKPNVVKRDIYRASNTRSNDIIHTKLEVAFDWSKSQLNGKAELLVKPYFYPTSTLYLNAKGMTINKIEVVEMGAGLDSKQSTSAKNQGKTTSKVLSASYIYENDSLKIHLGKQFTANQNYMVKIEYVAKPNELKAKGGSNAISDDKGLYFINPSGENPYKMPQVWTQGETQASSVWFPTIDSPNEKMTQEILMTVDQKYTTLSNGVLVSSKPLPGGKRLDHWKQDQPHAPYLAMMAVGEFKKVVDAPWNGKEISYYVEKEYEPHARAIFGDTKEMIDYFSKRLGVPYPWAKYSQIVVRDYVSGAMENTSATLHGDFMVYQTPREMVDGKKGNGVIAHELFHQWFGDLVTSESWSNLPLNESFATYAEYLWEEYKSGRDEADYRHSQSRQGYMASQKEVDLIRFNYHDKEDMFDAFSYNKGGQVLHMLRKAVGDEAFFASLKNYLETNKFKPAEIHHLRLAFEETTGKDMNWFFNQWFLNKGRPKLKLTKTYLSGTGIVELSVEQAQDLKSTPLYVLPVEVDIYENGKVVRQHIDISEQKETFKFKVNAEPQLINFDAERQLLCDLEYTKSTEEYMFQYMNAPLYGDKIEALKNLDAKISETEVFNLFKDVAQKEKFYALRNYAMSRLEKAPTEKLPELKNIYTSIYLNDSKTTSRAKALSYLNRLFKEDQDIAALNEKALNEQSYAICAEGLEAIVKKDPKAGMQKVKAFENETGKNILFVIANLYAEHGGDDEIAFFHKSLTQMTGFELIPFCSAYNKTAKRANNSENVLLAAKDFEILTRYGNKYTKYATLKCLKDLLTTWEEKENRLQKTMEVSKNSQAEFDKLNKDLQEATQLREKLSVMYNSVK